jgi:hypothetical protein
VLSGLNEEVKAELLKAGMDTILGKQNIHNHITKAIERAVQILEAKK